MAWCTRQLTSSDGTLKIVPSTWSWLLNQAQQDPPLEILQSDSTRATLCSYCVLCGQHMQRSGALLPHIQNDHGSIYAKALEDHPTLLATLQGIARCHCTHKVRFSDHHCPVHGQILLLRSLGTPLTLKQADPTDSDFLGLWENAAIRAKLTQSCGYCQQSCGISELGEHLKQHADMFKAALPLLPRAQSPFMDCCDACLRTSHLPEYCPVALNLCYHLLSHGLRSPPDDGRGPDGRPRRNLGQLSADQKASRPRGRSAEVTASSSHSSSPATGLETRVPVASTSHGGPIHHFFTRRPKGHPAHPLQGLQAMEGATGEAADINGPSNSPMASPDPRTSGETGEGDEINTAGGALAGAARNSSADGGGGVELHDLQCSAEEADPHRAQADPYGYHEVMDPGNERAGPEPPSDPSLQSIAPPDQSASSSKHLPLASPSDGTIQSAVGTPQFPQSLRHLAAIALPPTATPVSIKPLGRDIGPALARPIEKAAAARACLMLRLRNDGVTCYVNANLTAFTWSMLQRENADWSDFERGEQAFHTLLTDGLYNTFALETAGFESLEAAWGIRHNQQDAHEFTHVMLDWCRPDSVNLTWSRRFVNRGNVIVYDTGSREMPPTLTIGGKEKGSCSLQQLIDRWSAHSGMKTCFHFSTELLCLHLDRLTRNDLGEICRADWDVEINDAALTLLADRQHVALLPGICAGGPDLPLRNNALWPSSKCSQDSPGLVHNR